MNDLSDYIDLVSGGDALIPIMLEGTRHLVSQHISPTGSISWHEYEGRIVNYNPDENLYEIDRNTSKPIKSRVVNAANNFYKS